MSQLQDHQKIIDVVRTKEELSEFYEGLRKLEKALYTKDSGTFNELCASLLGEQVGDCILQMVSENGINVLDSAKASFFIGQIKEDLGNAEFLMIALAFAPDGAFIDRLYKWAKSNLGGDIFLDITVDKHILGGAVLHYKGKIIDRSLLKNIDEVIRVEINSHGKQRN